MFAVFAILDISGPIPTATQRQGWVLCMGRPLVNENLGRLVSRNKVS